MNDLLRVTDLSVNPQLVGGFDAYGDYLSSESVRAHTVTHVKVFMHKRQVITMLPHGNVERRKSAIEVPKITRN
jgi:hypothetical protein